MSRKVFRVIMWVEEETENRDPFDAHRLPVVRTRSRETFFIQTTNQADAVKNFKANLGKLNAEK